MPTLYVARSPALSAWASDVGLSKHVFKIGVTDAPVKELVAEGWAGLADWSLVKNQEVEALDEAEVLQRLAHKERLIDPNLYPRLKGAAGIFKVLPAHVENHILVVRALAGTEESADIKLKPGDFAAYLLHNALRQAAV